MLAIRAARMFDGLADRLIDEPLVLVDGARIVSVQAGRAAPDTAALDTVELVDLGQATLLPGLIDAHIHLALDAGADPVASLGAATDAQVLHRMRAAARTCLAAGITTVRDLGDRNYLALRLRAETASHPEAGPQVLAAGPPITTTRGHCWFLGGEADGVEGVRAAVRERAERGVDVVKLMASGGDLTPGTVLHVPQYQPDVLRAAVEEAHRHRLPITAHAHAASVIPQLVRAGFDGIEHCTFMVAGAVQADQAVIESLARSGVVVSATVGYLPRAAQPGPAAQPGLARPSRIPASLGDLLPAMADAFRRMRDAGVTIICTSDAGIEPAKPHDVLPYGLEMMVNLREMSTVQALRAATSTAARACRLGERKGRIAAGFDADLLAVEGDPLADITALRAVTAVFRSGQRVR